MNKYTKAGLLVVTLVIPALIFTFLRFFATNHYGVPYYHPLIDSGGKIVIKNGDTLFYQVSGIKGIKSDGTKVPDGIFKNKLTVVNYLPENCNDTCQIALGNLERVYRLRESIKNLELFTITDSSYNIEGHKEVREQDGWLFVKVLGSGAKEVLDTVLKYQTKVPAAKTNSTDNKLILIDEDGHVRGYYNGSEREETDRLMAEIKILDFEKKEALKK